jgi:hypothetical protein
MALSFKATARLAGLAYLVVAIAGAFNLMVVPSQIIVDGDGAATLDGIRANLSLMRLGIAAGVVCQVAFVVTPVLLYVLLQPFGRIASLLMLGFALVAVPMAFANIGHHMALLSLATGDATAGDAVAEAGRHLNTYDHGSALVAIFWGLWLAPFGWLVAKTGVIPRIIGVFLMLGCAGYLISFFATLLAPSFEASPIAEYIHLPSAIGELGACLWLLIFGAKDKRRTAQAA